MVYIFLSDANNLYRSCWLIDGTLFWLPPNKYIIYTPLFGVNVIIPFTINSGWHNMLKKKRKTRAQFNLRLNVRLCFYLNEVKEKRTLSMNTKPPLGTTSPGQSEREDNVCEKTMPHPKLELHHQVWFSVILGPLLFLKIFNIWLIDWF